MTNAAKKLDKDKSKSEEFKLEVGGTPAELGLFQFNVLSSVVARRFDDATKQVDEYQKKQSVYSYYVAKTEIIYTRTRDLINAIRKKVDIPNFGTLSKAKQEEIFASVSETFALLKTMLRRLRAIETELATEDGRSSIIVIKAVIFTTMLILTAFVVKEFIYSTRPSFLHFVNDTVKFVIKSFD